MTISLSESNNISKTKAKTFDGMYRALSFMMSEDNRPMPKTRITNHTYIQVQLIEFGFIVINQNKELELCSKNGDEILHYIVSPKGHEYIKRYEHFKELFNSKK